MKAIVDVWEMLRPQYSLSERYRDQLHEQVCFPNSLRSSAFASRNAKMHAVIHVKLTGDACQSFGRTLSGVRDGWTNLGTRGHKGG